MQTQLFSIAGGQALLRIGGRSATFTVGDTWRIGDVLVETLKVTDTVVVLRYEQTSG